MDMDHEEERLLRSVALQNARAVFLARERAERELIQANQRITNILESITDGFVVFDKDWRIIFLNRRGEEILRPLYDSKQSVLGRSHWEAFPETVGTPLEAHYRHALKEQVSVHFENFYPPLNAWFDIRIYPSPEGLSVYFQDITQPKRAAEEIRQQREWFEVTLSSIGDAVITTDISGNVTYLNSVAETMTGWNLPEALGTPLEKVFNIINEFTGKPATNPIRKVIAEGGVVGLANHTKLIARDGSERAIEDSAAPITNLKGEVIGIVMVFHDVTERRKIEETLRSSEEHFRATFHQAAVGMAIAGKTGTFERVNKRFADIVGYTAAELCGLSFKTLTHPDDLPDTEREMHRLMNGNISHFALEKRYIKKDGTIVWVLVTVTDLKDPNGKPARFIGVVEDITSRKNAEEGLRRSEEELRTLANSIPQLAWMAEADGKIFWYNHGWFDYTGTTIDQMKGWGWQSVHDPKMLPLVLERWTISIQTGQQFEMEFPLRGADGIFRWFLTRVNPLRNADGQVVRWFGTNTNVDDVRRAQESLKEETRILDLLNKTGIAVASHLDLESLVQAVTDAGRDLSGAKFGAFFYNVIDEKGESLLLYTLSGAPREAFAKFGMPRNTPIFHQTFSGRGVMRSADITKDPRYGTMSPHHGMPKGHLPVCSYLAVPVISRSGEVIGGLFFGHPEPNIFSERSERLMVGLAAQAAVAIDNARLFENAQRQIAERKRTEEILREKEQFNRSIIDSSRDCIKILDLAGNLIAMAESGQRMLCIPDISPYLNKSWLNFWEGADREAARSAVKEAVRGNRGNFVGFFKTFSGEPRWWDVAITPIVDAAGKPEKLLAVSRDVTERKHSEDAKALLAAVVQSSDDAIISTDLNGTILTWNEGASRMYGYHSSEMFQQSITRLFPPNRLDEEPAVLAQLKRGERIAHYETVRVRKDGTLLDVALTVSPVKDSQGQVIGISKIARDITERKRAQKDLQRAKDELEQRVLDRTASLLETTAQLEAFCYTIAHDLRSPLRAQQSYAQLLLEDFQDQLGSEGTNYAKRILGSAKRLDQLVNDLLTYSRVSRDELKLTTIDLGEFLNGVQAQLDEDIRRQGATLTTGILLPVLAYGPTLNLVITNLISNALKFVPPGVHPQIFIWSELKEKRVRLWVEDNGIGISPENTEKIFGVFQRLHRIDDYPGTGIGLAIVQKGVERMGGAVGVESQPGTGSRFWIELQRAV